MMTMCDDVTCFVDTTSTGPELEGILRIKPLFNQVKVTLRFKSYFQERPGPEGIIHTKTLIWVSHKLDAQVTIKNTCLIDYMDTESNKGTISNTSKPRILLYRAQAS